ncbi:MULTISPECIES: DMT family transporter [unclassified Stappia]|uniref:DMT family transporter n=1 Tax=unclassified Stappia TaxID=2629676 RepID=UPI001AD8F90F|nr:MULTISPECIES: DMT family transporter [unclassified Stappia]
MLGAIFTGLQVGAALVASEAVVAEVGAGRLGFLRYAIALLILLPVAFFSSGAPVARRDMLPVALIGIGQFGVLVGLLNVAVLHTGSPRVALVFATLPIVTLAVGLRFAVGRVSPLELASILLSVVGVGILLAGEALTGRMLASDWIGVGCAALATLTGALCSHLYRPYLQRCGVAKVSVIAMLASLLPLGVMALLEGQGLPMADWSRRTVMLVGFVGLSSGAGFLLWLYALSRLPAAVVTAFLGLSPVTAVVLSVLFLGATPTLTLAVAMVLVVGSLAATAVAQRRGRKPAPPLPVGGSA